MIRPHHGNPPNIPHVPPTRKLNSQFSRPGRKYHKAVDIDMESAYRQHHGTKKDADIRIFFQNMKGLTYSASGEDYNYYLSCARNLAAD